MKKKLTIALLIVTALSIVVSLHVFIAMKDMTLKFHTVISIYKIHTMREKLGYQLRKVQGELVAKDTPYQLNKTNTIIGDMEELDRIMGSCFDCHHEPKVYDQLALIHTKVDEFKAALGLVLAGRVNDASHLEPARYAYDLGERLLTQVDGMLAAASSKLEKRSKCTMAEVLDITRIMALILFVLPLLFLVAGLYFMSASCSMPIATLIEATEKLGQGDLRFRVKGLKDEFGRLGDSFNVMADSLANQVQVTQRAEQMTVVGQMAAGLAHEIKNPLTGIKLSMEVLKGQAYLPDQDRQMLTMVVAVINRVNRLINDLLHFARPSLPCLQRIAINPLLEMVTNSARYALARSHSATAGNPQPLCTCTTVLAPDLPEVQADPEQVQQIILNLILNAFDAMPQGGTVTVSSALAPVRGCVAVTITDTGSGISAAIREKIFIPFFSTKKKGTGLGLAICKTLAGKNGGDLTVNDNTEAGGASFSLFLPLADEQGGAG